MAREKHEEILRAIGSIEAKVDGINARLDKVNGRLDKHDDQIVNLRLDDGISHTKLSMWGAFAGLIVSLATSLLVKKL